MPYRGNRWATVHERPPKNETTDYTATCQCGKRSYLTRRQAKQAMRAARNRLADTGHWSVYRCPTNPVMFHYGHLAPGVITGEVGRGELYGHGP
jgi:hypothetical protein